MSPPLPSSLGPIKPANPGSPGKMAIKTEREKERMSPFWTLLEPRVMEVVVTAGAIARAKLQ